MKQFKIFTPYGIVTLTYTQYEEPEEIEALGGKTMVGGYYVDPEITTKRDEALEWLEDWFKQNGHRYHLPPCGTAMEFPPDSEALGWIEDLTIIETTNLCEDDLLY